MVMAGGSSRLSSASAGVGHLDPFAPLRLCERIRSPPKPARSAAEMARPIAWSQASLHLFAVIARFA